MTATQAIERYIRSLRNKHKRDYALAYVEFLREGETGEPPISAPLSYMAAQGVRLTLTELAESSQ
jgi:hypothetical protein